MPNGVRHSIELRKKAVLLYKKIGSYSAVAKELGCSRSVIKACVTDGVYSKCEKNREEEELEIIKLWKDNPDLNLKELARKTIWSACRVSNVLHRRGVRIKITQQYSEEIKQKALSLYPELQSTYQVAKIVGVTHSAVYDWVNHLIPKHKRRTRFLTAKEQAGIVEMLNDGSRPCDIARKFDISEPTVYYYRNRALAFGE